MFRPAMILTFLLVASLTVMLFVVKYQVQDLEKQLVEFNRAITEDRQAIHVLKAEWSHLNEPARLRNLAARYLGLGAIHSRQVGTADEWFSIIPAAAAAEDDPPARSVSIEEVPQ